MEKSPLHNSSIWDKLFKNGPSKIYGRSPLKFFKFFKGCLQQILLGLFLDTLSHMLQPSEGMGKTHQIRRDFYHQLDQITSQHKKDKYLILGIEEFTAKTGSDHALYPVKTHELKR